MAEYDSIAVTNALFEDITVRYNGEPYTLLKQETKHYPEFLGLHIAKHISDRLLEPIKAELRNTYKENPFRPQVTILCAYDNPDRRIALYKILRSKELVEATVNMMGLKGFVGEMKVYDNFADDFDRYLNAETITVEEDPNMPQVVSEGEEYETKRKK